GEELFDGRALVRVNATPDVLFSLLVPTPDRAALDLPIGEGFLHGEVGRPRRLGARFERFQARAGLGREETAAQPPHIEAVLRGDAFEVRFAHGVVLRSVTRVVGAGTPPPSPRQ